MTTNRLTTATIDAAVRLVTAFRDFADLQDTAATYYPKFYGKADTKAEAIAHAIVVQAFNAWAAEVGRDAVAFDKHAPAIASPRETAEKVEQVMRAGCCTLVDAVAYLEAEEWDAGDAITSLRGDRRDAPPASRFQRMIVTARTNAGAAAAGVALSLELCPDTGFAFVLSAPNARHQLAAERTTQDRLEQHLAGFAENVKAAAMKSTQLLDEALAEPLTAEAQALVAELVDTPARSC